ncbi:MAG TPA: 50S ribosomal protein L4 [Candidatus Omnitrophota bacterium]|nr:50S ribosomal protein L4 [Candidatus Omnitrophota bacterium]HRZ15710.1 50S ribosomal protein L4 [Candidatus Omnitrophota bacterium]
MFTLPVFDSNGKEINKITLDEKIFSDKIKTSPVYQVIAQYRAAQRKGLASTKTRGEVSGGGKKPWRQKGTGRARVGSTRSPLWRHGGVVFGPHPRDFSYSIPKKIKTVALKQALSAKAAENNLLIVDEVSIAASKTKELKRMLGNLKIGDGTRTVLLVVAKMENELSRAGRNLGFLNIAPAAQINTYAVLTSDAVLATNDGLNALVKRLKK